jgi:hypothetical protein
MIDEVVPFTVDRQAHVGLRFNLDDRTLHINDFSERYLKSAIVQLAEKIDRSIWQEAIWGSFNATGTPGLGTTYETIIRARASNMKLAWPDDGMTRFVLNPDDAAEHRLKLTTVNNDGLVKSAIERSYINRMAGYDGYEAANIPVHTVGVKTGTPLVNAGGQTGSSIVTKGWTNSTTGILKKGDIISFAGVFAVNPQTYESTGELAQFVVTADVNSGASTGPATIPISPALNDGTLTTADGNGDTVSLAAYQNVTNAPAADAPITVLGTGGVQYRQNLMLHRDAVMLACVDMHRPEAAVVAKQVRDEESGFSMLMTAAYDISNTNQTYRIDILWGVKTMYPELTRRVFGHAS